MGNKNNYYENIADRVHEILQNNGPSYERYDAGYCISKGSEPKTYYINPMYNGSAIVRMEHALQLTYFINDLKDHLDKDKPFKIIYNENWELYFNFLKKLSKFLYDCSVPSYSYNNNTPIIPSVGEFQKTIRAFEPMVHTIVPLIQGFPSSYQNTDGMYNKFIPGILSLHNEALYLNESPNSIKKIINSELESLTGPFCDEKDMAIKEGIVAYLEKKKPFLIENKDKEFEIEILKTIKYVLDSDYWLEVASYLPNLDNRKDQKISTEKNIFNLNSNPIFHIDLNVQSILDISPTIVTEEDFYTMLSRINDSINLHKPYTIDRIQNIDFKIIVSGSGATQDLTMKIGELFEKMIQEYNSKNYLKKSFLTTQEEEENKEYLNKAAETYWLDIGLKDFNSKPAIKKKNKI